MLWALFGVLNVFYRYVACALGPDFLVLNTIIALVDESHVSRAAASTFEGLGYYYDCL